MFLLPSFTTYARRQRDPREREVSAPLLNLPLVGRSDGAGGGVGVGAHATALRGSKHVAFLVSALNDNAVHEVAAAMAAPVAHALEGV